MLLILTDLKKKKKHTQSSQQGRVVVEAILTRLSTNDDFTFVSIVSIVSNDDSFLS